MNLDLIGKGYVPTRATTFSYGSLVHILAEVRRVRADLERDPRVAPNNLDAFVSEFAAEVQELAKLAGRAKEAA